MMGTPVFCESPPRTRKMLGDEERPSVMSCVIVNASLLSAPALALQGRRPCFRGSSPISFSPLRRCERCASPSPAHLSFWLHSQLRQLAPESSSGVAISENTETLIDLALTFCSIACESLQYMTSVAFRSRQGSEPLLIC